MNGVVSRRWVLAGDVVSPGQPIFTVYDLENIWVTANLEETSISALRSTDSVEISVARVSGPEVHRASFPNRVEHGL